MTQTQEWSWKTGSPSKKERMAAYVEWLLTPAAEREPRTKAELAAALGVSDQTLRNYAQEPWLKAEVTQRSRTLFRVERAQDVIESLYHQARDEGNPRSVQAAKVLLDWAERRLTDETKTDVKELSNDDLTNLAVQLLKRASETTD